MLYRVVHEEPQLYGVPDALAPLIRACLAKDPDERPSTLQLSLRLKEIAAREAQGLDGVRPPVPRAAEADRPTGRLVDTYPEQQRTGGVPPPVRRCRARAPRPGAGCRRAAGAPRGEAPARGGTVLARRCAVPGAGPPRGAAAVRAVAVRPGRVRRAPTPGAARRRPTPGGRPAPRGGSGRPGQRPARTGRRPANPRLLRQRLFVFVVVTLLVALGIAVAQDCQGPARGLGDDGGVQPQRHAQPGYPPAGDGKDVSDQQTSPVSHDAGN